ncbi:protein sneaky [Armigeres subalbatus]|uniref:protein sneaky n=1 Tax=Armigeres subalbatus TaxID=124917 RepID=UPI002ED601AE
MKCLKTYFHKFVLCCRTRFPRCARLCGPDKSFTNQIIRSMLLYFYGLLLGILFWRHVLLKLWMSFDFVFPVGIAICLFLGYGCALSVQIRCYSSLCLTGFLGKAGRGMLKAIVLTCILTGPINNICLNAREVVRVFTCSTELTYNLSKARFDLMAKPFQNALLGSKNNLEQVKEEFVGIVDIIEPIKEEVTGYDNDSNYRQSRQSGEQYRKRYVQKLRNRCEAQLQNGVKRCEQTFQKVYDDCHEKLPILVNYLLCWPMKLDLMCGASQVFGNKDAICSAENVVDSEFGEDYVQLIGEKEKLTGNLEDVNIQYEFVDIQHQEGYLTAKETSKQIRKEFERKKESFDMIVYIWEKFFALVILRVTLNALSYHQKYLKKIDFENHYISEYFIHIDQRRIYQGKVNILPLRRIERSHLVDLESASCTRLEFRKIIVQLLTLVLQSTSASVFVLLDALFFETLDIVSRNSRVEFKQEGHHDINVTVTGTGVIAMMVRRSVEGFKSQFRVDVLTSNEECLPRPHKLDDWDLAKIYLLLLGVAVLVLNEAYINRLKRLICAWFYPKREKQRILYLYNRMLKRRKQLHRSLVEKLKEYIRMMKYGATLDFLNRLQFYLPACCGWIRMVHKKSCSLCGYNKAKTLNECNNYNCFLAYCDECWQDVKQECLACKAGSVLDHDCSIDH